MENDEKIIILGAAGFLGTNLTKKLLKMNKKLTLVCSDLNHIELFDNVEQLEVKMNVSTDYDSLLDGYDTVYHLLSTTQPTNSNISISDELIDNVIVTSKILDACVKVGVKKVIFISSGGTVYGKDVNCPIKEDSQTNPISAYGLQKLTIEKLLFLYNYVYGIDYKIFRLSNPYGPYQRPDGRLGAVTTFIYKVMCGDIIEVYGDGTVVRDYIYVDDAMDAIMNAMESKEKIFNIGSGIGTDLNSIIKKIERVLNKHSKIKYLEKRTVDVPVNYLDISKYENMFGKLVKTSLEDGIFKTAEFLRKKYTLEGIDEEKNK